MCSTVCPRRYHSSRQTPSWLPCGSVCLWHRSVRCEVVSMLHTAFLGTVHRLSVFLLGVHRGTETHKWEQYSCLQETLFPLTHQVVLHLNLCRATPALAFYQSEHRAEAVCNQVHVLVAVVSVAHHALACDIVGVVCLRPCLVSFSLRGRSRSSNEIFENENSGA